MRFCLLTVLALFLGEAIAETGEIADLFTMTSERNIMRPEHLGIINHRLSCGTPYENVGTLDGFWAPPLVSSDSNVHFSIDGAPVPTDSWTWWPMRFVAEGKIETLSVKSDCLLVTKKRTAIVRLTFENPSETTQKFRAALRFSSPSLDRSDVWDFATEQSQTPCTASTENDALLFTQGDLAVVFAGKSWTWDAESLTGTALVTLEPSESTTLEYAVVIGEKAIAASEAIWTAEHAEETFAASLADYERDFAAIFERLPCLESENEALVRLYNRSVMHFFTNRWETDEFVLNPYFATGGMKGGCTCCYLWNYGEPWEIMQLYDPAASRAHIRQFLGINLCEHYAFRPTTGIGTGPWYMINQEKILGHLYYYVKLTGDTSFLAQSVEGRPIYEHIFEQATARDDPTRPVALIDYGESNSHLELRRAANLYNHIMPDLNGRRYANYIMGAALLRSAGHADERLVGRAEELKRLLKEKLWNQQTKWFDFIDDRGKPQTRWTIQMYKLIHSDVLDSEELDGLLSHWNEKEFLGEYGVHSLALTDPWFDPNDVDNGGPGACTDFGPQIAERFYKARRPQLGGDILRRMFWLGERMPYWGDSVEAGRMEYRHDTPLQCMFDSVTIAQTIIFGMFGVTSRFDGSVEITPSPPDFAPTTTLRGVRLRGFCFDVILEPNNYRVLTAEKEATASYGQTVELTEKGFRVLDAPTETENGLPIF